MRVRPVVGAEASHPSANSNSKAALMIGMRRCSSPPSPARISPQSAPDAIAVATTANAAASRAHVMRACTDAIPTHPINTKDSAVSSVMCSNGRSGHAGKLAPIRDQSRAPVPSP